MTVLVAAQQTETPDALPSRKARLAYREGLVASTAGVAPGFVPFAAPVRVSFAYLAVGGAGPTLAAVHRNGSFAFSLAELRNQAYYLPSLSRHFFTR